MILYREIKHTDIEELKAFFTENEMELTQHMAYLHNSMLLKVDDLLCGFAGYRMLTETTAMLEYVYITLEQRGNGYGDGLIKALLNTAENRGVKIIFSSDCFNESKESLMESVGFSPINEGERLALSELINHPQLTHIAHLPEYFLTACKSKRVAKG